VSSENSDPPGRPGDRPLPAHLDPRLGRLGSGRAARADEGDDGGGAHPAGDGRRPTPRVAVVTRVLAGVVSATLLIVSGWGWYLGQLAQATVTRTDAIPTSGNEDAVDDGAAMNLLLVGQDGREDLTKEQLAELNAGANDSGGLNTDTMILVHLPADGSSASFVSFPRDSYVQIPGHGSDKLNAAYAYGYTAVDKGASAGAKEAAGAQLLVQTISRLTGLQIDHYAEVDLLGFFELTQVVGGVQVNLCQAVDDREFSGAYFPAGPQTIAGADALKFVRQRHHLGENGRGDYDRIIRQQVFLAGVLRNMLSSNVLLSPGRQRELVGAAAQSLTVDQDLDLFQLATQMQSVTLDSITFQTVPYIGNDRDDQNRDIIRLQDEDTLHRFFAQLSADPGKPAETPAGPPATVAPSEVSVEVRNGSGKAGLAARAKGELEAAGFTVTGTGNADTSDYARTVVRHAAGDEARAAAVAAQVPGSAVELDDTLTAGTVRLVLGKDFTGIGVAPSTQPAPDEVQGADLRNAQDTSCIN